MAQAGRRRAKSRSRPGPKQGFAGRALRGLLTGVLRALWWLGVRLAVLALVVLAVSTAYYYARLPAFAALLDGREVGSVTLIDAGGEVFAWRGEQLGLIRAEAVSPHLRNAVIATEDRRFYHHFGIDPLGAARALIVNLRAGQVVQGGSSITQQVAKLVWFDNDRTLERKLKEIPAALALELKFTKDQILSIYLNRAYLGAGATGFEAASQRYFGKSAADVTPAEAAMLAGLLRAPSRFAPTNDLARSQDRARVIIDVMEDEGHLTAAQAAEARARPAVLSQAAAARAGGDFADWVMSAGPDFLTRSTTEDVELLTTFDARIQRAAETALEDVFATKVKAGSNAQAAIVVMTPDGAVRALVGGRRLDGTTGQFNRATQAKRQTGSLFKTFVYGAALESGARSFDQVYDAPLTLDVPGSGPWSPQNYAGSYLGLTDLTTAFARSINTAAVRVSEGVGRERVRALARDFGVSSEIDAGPAVALGTSEATLLEMTGAFAGILNGGVRARPYGLREVRLKAGGAPLMDGDRARPVRVMDERAAAELVYMMSQVVERGTGGRAKLPDRPAAGKTGTTQAARDAWFIGFTADYVAGVWMGYDDNTPLTGTTGGGLPAEIWRETMIRVHDGVPLKGLPMLVPEPPATPPVIAQTGPTASGPSPSGIVSGVETAVRSIVEDVMRGLLGN